MSHEHIDLSSENFAAVHPEIMEALVAENHGRQPSYGRDTHSFYATASIRSLFGGDPDVHFTFNGTGANVFGIGTMGKGYSAVICSDISHLYVDESTAPETFSGCRLYPVVSKNGKVTPEGVMAHLQRLGDVHHPQARILTITQPTECGTVYSIQELIVLKKICTANGLLLHVDGARYFNALAHLGLAADEVQGSVGFDIMTLGGTKAGLMFGEAVLVFSGKNPGHRYNLKRSMQLASKQRYIAIQFRALLNQELFSKIAQHSNAMARRFILGINGFRGIALAYPVETNMVFLIMNPAIAECFSEYSSFYFWNKLKNEYSFVFAFDTTPSQVDELISRLSRHLHSLSLSAP